MPELEILREQYDKAQETIYEDAQAKLRHLNHGYLQSLDDLIGQLTRQGKLESALAVRTEKNRLLSIKHDADDAASKDKADPDRLPNRELVACKSSHSKQ